jgi:hypothetical protein
MELQPAVCNIIREVRSNLPLKAPSTCGPDQANNGHSAMLQHGGFSWKILEFAKILEIAYYRSYTLLL